MNRRTAIARTLAAVATLFAWRPGRVDDEPQIYSSFADLPRLIESHIRDFDEADGHPAFPLFSRDGEAAVETVLVDVRQLKASPHFPMGCKFQYLPSYKPGEEKISRVSRQLYDVAFPA